MRPGVTAVHQFLPVLAPADAMSQHVFALRARIREWGYESHAYAVDHVMNIKDVEDTSIKKSTAQGLTNQDYTAPYVRSLEEDIAAPSSAAIRDPLP